MVSQKYRWDFIGLSTDTKPTSETSDKVVNGSTYYCSDTSKLYVYCDGTWYERKSLGGGGGGGTSNFNQLTNRPKYNGTDMTGSTNIPEVVTYSDFTGTDGTTAGEAGLVPGPVATDAGKFLKADGTWAEVQGGGGATELTTADYDFPADNPTRVALWKLSNGWYTAQSSVGLQISASSLTSGGNFIIAKDGANTWIVQFSTSNTSLHIYKITSSGQTQSDFRLPTSVVQITGTSTTDVMSQNATTSMVYRDPATKRQIQIGAGSTASGNYSVAIGQYTSSTANGTVAIGGGNNGAGAASATAQGSIALGIGAKASVVGEMNIGTTLTTSGYNRSNYRLLTGLYDGQSAHDAATVAQGNTLATSAPTTSTVGVLGQLYTDTTNMHTYQCTAISGDTYTWTQRW